MMVAVEGAKWIVILILSLAFVAAEVSTEETTQVEEFGVGSQLRFRAPDGQFFDTSPGVQSSAYISCNRIRFRGFSRITNFQKFAYVAQVKLVQDDGHVSKAHVCVHRNASLGMCQCSKERWKSLEKHQWSTVRSPFDSFFIDVRSLGSLDSYTVTAHEEFRVHQVILLLVGLTMILVSGTLSSWVPFYYSSAMTLGIILVILILLYQGMKLIPTGRKSAPYILAFGSLLGVGSVILHYIAGFITSTLQELGLGEDDMLNPLVILFFVGIVTFGAWLGYWGVRKLVLSEDGSVDHGTSVFVRWALRFVGGILILQSSRDEVLGVSLLGISSGICYLWRRVDFSEMTFPVSWCVRTKSTPPNNEFLQKIWCFGRPSPSTGGVGVVRSEGDDYYSSYHSTSERMTKEEYEEVSRECTENAMKGLVESREFMNWVKKRWDRIMVSPIEHREERVEDEIGKTAYMEQQQQQQIEYSLPTRRRLAKYSL